jgi:hypothetical protein
MGRGINSGLIQIRPGRAQNMTLQRFAPGQQRSQCSKQKHKRTYRVTALYAAKAHCAEAASFGVRSR